jgi:diguanylate cyclase (GGDEF)-like protein
MEMKDFLKSIKILYRTENDFNLRRYFSFNSLVIIIVLTVILSSIVYWNQKNALIEYSISSATVFAQQINRSISSKIIDSALIKENNLLIEDNTNFLLQLDKISESFLNEYGDVKKIKIFNHEGKIVYSSDPDDIGFVNTGKNLKNALTGQTSTELTRRHTEFKEDSSNKGKKFSIDILEIYVPLYRDLNNPLQKEIIGAFEIYTDISAVYQLIRKEFYKVPLLLLFSMGILYLFLQIVIKKANDIINIKNEEINLHASELAEAQKRITSAIDRVIEDGSFHIRLLSDDLMKCWEVKNCTHIACPSYKSENLRCWQVSGTFCGGNVQGVFANKYGDCRACEVYKNAFKDRIKLIGESFNNMMVLLESKHKELQKMNEKLNVLIDTDPLTETGNRRSFQKRMESIHLLSLRYSHPYSIIVCDVDYFKPYNDTYGHQKGDYALVSVVNAMKTSVRRTDEIFRWGGEEFIIILPQQNMFAALKVARSLRATVESLGITHAASPSKFLTISVGVACNIAENVKYISWESVIKQADDELYKAKAAGKNCVYPAVNISNISDETI